MSVQEMIAKAGSLLRPNRFKCRINFPVLLGADEASGQTELWIESSTVPGVETGSIEIPVVGGHLVKIAGDPVFPEFSCTILASSDEKIYRAMRLWSETMSSALTGTRANDLAYFADIVIEQLDGIDNVVQTWSLVGAWPTSIGEIALSKETRDEVLRFDATFVYQYSVTDLV